MKRVMRFLARHARRLLTVLVVLAAAVAATYGSMVARFRRSIAAGPPAPPVGLKPGERSQDEIFDRLAAIPFDVVRPKALGVLRGAVQTALPSMLNLDVRTSARIYPYPEPFKEVWVESLDGTLLTAVMGLHSDGRRRPGLVISHGYTGSKNDHYVISTALTAFSEWGFNVLAADLRNHGRSRSLGFAATSFGWREGEDLLSAARHLGEQPGVTTVGVTGFSMGAGSTMRAAYLAKDMPYITGGALAWNGYTDNRRLLAYLDTTPAPTEPFFPFYCAFRAGLFIDRSEMRRTVKDPRFERFLARPMNEYHFEEYIEELTAPFYGVTPDEFFSDSSGARFLPEVTVPLLMVHAEDDPICPASEMEDAYAAARDNPLLKVWMLPQGHHCQFPYLAPKWYGSVMREYFMYWASWE